jgi:hypothetical protein
MDSFQPGLRFIPGSRAEISARPKDKILLKHSKRSHDRNFNPVEKQRLRILSVLFLHATTVSQKSNNRHEQVFKFFEEAE